MSRQRAGSQESGGIPPREAVERAEIPAVSSSAAECLLCLEALLALPRRGIPPDRPPADGSCGGCYALLQASSSLDLTRPGPARAPVLLVGGGEFGRRLAMHLGPDLIGDPALPLASPGEAVPALRDRRPALVALEWAGAADLAPLDELLAVDPELVVLLAGGSPSSADLLKALNRGAYAALDLDGAPAESREVWSRAVSVAALQRDRQRLREQIVRERRRERLTLSHLPLGVITLDSDGVVLEANARASALFGGERLMGRGFAECCVPHLSLRDRGLDLVECMDRAMRLREPLALADATVRHPRCRGETVVAVDLIPVPDLRRGEAGLLVCLRDVTQERALAETVVHQERLAAIGTMAASVAHELKNPLAGIAGALDVLLDAMPPQDDLLRIRDEVRRQVGRLSDLAQDLLGYAKPVRVSRIATTVATLVDSLRDTLERHPAFEGITVAVEGGDEPVEIDGVQFPTVMLNLLLNAAQAAGPGTTIRVIARRVDHELEIRVEDEGPGFTEESLTRAFEPFFTTKSRGTGLGLPLCRKIVVAHDGRLQLENRDGSGCAVITLPSGEAAPR